MDRELNQEELPEEDSIQAEEDAFNAAFAQASGGEEPAPEPEPEPQPEPKPEPEPEEEVIPEFGLTASAMRERLAQVDKMQAEMQQLIQHRDRQYGTIGELKQRIQTMQEAKPSQPTIRLTGESLKRLRGEYPELAELLAQDLSEAVSVGGGPASAGISSQEIEQMMAKRAAEAERRAQENSMKQVHQMLLAREHPDWKNVANSSDFTLWKANLDPRERTMLENSWDSSVISSALTAFKGWRDKQREKASSKRDRLERAIQPSGVVAKNDTGGEADAFMAGFNAVRSQRI